MNDRRNIQTSSNVSAIPFKRFSCNFFEYLCRPDANELMTVLMEAMTYHSTPNSRQYFKSPMGPIDRPVRFTQKFYDFYNDELVLEVTKNDERCWSWLTFGKPLDEVRIPGSTVSLPRILVPGQKRFH